MVRAVVLMILLAACGDNQPGVSLDDDAAAYRAATCQWWTRCGVVSSVDECATRNFDFADTEPLFERAVAEGSIVWNAAGAYDCIELVAAKSCDLTSETYRAAACHPWSGTLGDGEACFLDSECRSGACENDACDQACCAGTCVGDEAHASLLGDSCATRACAEGVCNGEVCVPFVPLGASCDDDADLCAYGAACVNGTCTTLPAHDEPCDGRCREIGDQCDLVPARDGLYCTSRKTLGASCSVSRQCDMRLLCTNQHCAYPDYPLGHACSWSTDCAMREAHCSSNGVCELPHENGMPCNTALDCASRVCDFSTSSCVDAEACW